MKKEVAGGLLLEGKDAKAPGTPRSPLYLEPGKGYSALNAILVVNVGDA